MAKKNKIIAQDWKTKPKEALNQESSIPPEYISLIPIQDKELTPEQRRKIATSMTMYPHVYLLFFPEEALLNYEKELSKKSKDNLFVMFLTLHENQQRTPALDDMLTRIGPLKRMLEIDKTLLKLRAVPWLNSGLSCIDYLTQYKYMADDKNYKDNIIDAYVDLCNQNKLTVNNFVIFVELCKQLNVSDIHALLQQKLKSGLNVLEYLVSQLSESLLCKYFDDYEMRQTYHKMMRSSLKTPSFFVSYSSSRRLKVLPEEYGKYKQKYLQKWKSVGSPKLHDSRTDVLWLEDKEQVKRHLAFLVKKKKKPDASELIEHLRHWFSTEINLWLPDSGNDYTDEEVFSFIQKITQDVVLVEEEELIIDF